MFPTLFSLGQFSLSSFGVCMAFAFITFIFLFWRLARNEGISDEVIFDNILTVTLSAFIFSRIFFMASHWSIFSPNLLRSFLVWKFPGLSFWGALTGGVFTFYFISRRQGLLPMKMFDVYALVLPPALFLVSTGIFLDGTVSGKETTWITGMSQTGVAGKYHPAGLYAFVLTLIFMGIQIILKRVQIHKKLGPGFLGWSALSFLGGGQLLLAFFRSDILYWDGFPVDYILATVLLIGPWGPMYKEIHGTELIKRGVMVFKTKAKTAYAKISKTHTHRN